MNGFILENGTGVLGLAIVNEARKIKTVAYLNDTRSLSVTFENGDTENLETHINQKYEKSLFGKKRIFIGHFADDSFDKDPTDEYYVSLEL